MKYIDALLLTVVLGSPVALLAVVTKTGILALIAEPTNVGNWAGVVMLLVVTVSLATTVFEVVRNNLQSEAA